MGPYSITIKSTSVQTCAQHERTCRGVERVLNETLRYIGLYTSARNIRASLGSHLSCVQIFGSEERNQFCRALASVRCRASEPENYQVHGLASQSLTCRDRSANGLKIQASRKRVHSNSTTKRVSGLWASLDSMMCANVFLHEVGPCLAG